MRALKLVARAPTPRDLQTTPLPSSPSPRPAFSERPPRPALPSRFFADASFARDRRKVAPRLRTSHSEPMGTAHLEEVIIDESYSEMWLTQHRRGPPRPPKQPESTFLQLPATAVGDRGPGWSDAGERQRYCPEHTFGRSLSRYAQTEPVARLKPYRLIRSPCEREAKPYARGPARSTSRP